MKTINLNVPQGIGDIIWIYQKISPLFDKININICILNTETPSKTVQERSLKWLRILPKIGKIGTLEVLPAIYSTLLKSKIMLKDIINNNKYSFYSCNLFLEEGIRLENIDNYPIEENIDFPIKKLDIAEDYIVLYISASISPWKVKQWVNLIELFYNKLNFSGMIYIIGASFDEKCVQEASEKLKLKHKVFIDLEPEQVCYLIKHAKYFIGHQSGLNIIADILDTKQIMVYYEHLNKLRLSWPKIKNINSYTYNSYLFNSSAEEIVDNIARKQLKCL